MNQEQQHQTILRNTPSRRPNQSFRALHAAGNPLSYIQMKAGHSQAAITERYIHAAQVQFAGAAERAEERMFSGAKRQLAPLVKVVERWQADGD